MIKSDSISKLAPALLKAQKEMGVAIKDSKNPFFKSKFADLNSVIDASIPAMNANGIAVLQTPQINGSEIVIETILLHESGEYLSSQTAVVSAKQNDPQALGSAISYARRYGLQSTVTLKSVDDDSESAMNRVSAISVTTASNSKQNTVMSTTASDVATTVSSNGKVQETTVPKFVPKRGPVAAKTAASASDDI